MTPLDWTHAVRDIPSDGLAIERTVTAEEAARLADALGVVSVDKLVAKYRLTPAPGARVALTGKLDIRVTQECVVTLDPLPSTVSLPLDAVFTSQSANADAATAEVTLDDLENPAEEPIENGTVDVGRVVLEELMSGIDPYPRSADARFDWTDDKADPTSDKPFAALARLRKTDGSN